MVIPPLHIRKLRAEMEMKALSLHEVAKGAGINYHQASSLLNGRRENEEQLDKIAEFIKSVPMPKEVVA